ncbi:hypothetical protein AN189_17505 [Loktanella sp. 3ANDIMAR09]|uniref:hypothetical protein n=1 Tax=Loktanella sp. 3ANDIMAR09 TaxID=1225657 RepID=UPI0006F531A3|nr:hypothetical protein [Loktanella sp. 3ANDIMAR09]KQI67022.1 hypothetical protein AN189_17505 [Loktanella sp. 3ANDIMAR09]
MGDATMTTNKFGSIQETGAQPGDTVICVGHRDEAERQNFTKGGRYRVVLAGTQLCVHPNSTQANGHRIPRVGYGAFWVLDAADQATTTQETHQ